MSSKRFTRPIESGAGKELVCVCPRSSLQVTSCDKADCYNYIPNLTANCLRIHCEVFNKQPEKLLPLLYNRYEYGMSVAMRVIKMKYVMAEFSSMKKKPWYELAFEKTWRKKIQQAPDLQEMSWREWLEAPSFKLKKLTVSALKSIGICEYPLSYLVRKYYEMYNCIDIKNFGIFNEERGRKMCEIYLTDEYDRQVEKLTAKRTML